MIADLPDDTTRIELPEKLIDLFDGPAKFRCAYGGRGSGKTRSFATMAAVHGAKAAAEGIAGIILCCRELQNSLSDSSMAEVKSAIDGHDWLRSEYEIGETFIRTRCGKVAFVFVGLRHNLDSIKSKSKILLCWIDEADPVPEEAWRKLIPTVREENAEIWVTWNPERKNSATKARFKIPIDDDIKTVEINWRDNEKFPATLEAERLRDLRDRPESYQHIWEGEEATIIDGAYFAEAIALAKAQCRIGRVSVDPLMAIRAFFDIGGTGAKSDACAIWMAQFIGKEVRVIDYYEAVGQPLATHVQWLRDNGYGAALVYLPHDGVTHDRVYDVTYESALRQAGFTVEVITNQGAGAAKQRIEAARRVFPLCWFDEFRCDAGLSALGWYHEKRDDVRGIGLGPEHDWSSHGADAFGMMALVAELKTREAKRAPAPRARINWRTC